MATIMVIPVLLGHKSRYSETEERSKDRYTGLARVGFEIVIQPVNDSQYAETDPDTKSIEGACVRIVTFTRLVRRLIEVHNDGKTGKEEEDY